MLSNLIDFLNLEICFKTMSFPRITLYLLLPLVSALSVITVFERSGPVVQVSSDSVSQKFINVMCTHRGKRYIGGHFNRFGDRFAKSFAVLNENDEIEFLGEIGKRSNLEDTNRKPYADYSSRVSAMAW